MKSVNLLQIHHTYTSLPLPEKDIVKLVGTIYEKEKVSGKRVTNIVFCSDYVIRKLNRDYREKDKATDVLSFPFDDSDLLGEIYISLQRAKVQAKRFGISYNDEISRLVVHGMFHLLGFDHIEDKDRKKMEAKEHKYINLDLP
jgi:probable rRNA maturation factor